MQLAALPHGVDPILFILSHSQLSQPRKPLPSPSPLPLAVLSEGRYFPGQRDRDCITGKESGGRRLFPSAGFSDPSLEGRGMAGHAREEQTLIGKTK